MNQDLWTVLQDVTGQALLPYGGTSGWAGSETSRQRAFREDVSGRTKHRQEVTIRALEKAGNQGLTLAELSEATGMHYGQSSGALSRLHKAGYVARLTMTRGRCSIYVTLENVAGRETSLHGSTRSGTEHEALERVIALVNSYPAFGQVPVQALLDTLKGE